MARPTRTRSGQVKQQQVVNTTKKWKKRAFRVDPGDVVHFHTNNIHMLGAVGTVVGYISEHEVLVRTFGGTDSDYQPMYISLYDRIPNEHYVDQTGKSIGSMLFHYGNYITKIVHQVNPQQRKARKRTPVRFLRVHPEALPSVLSGEIEVERGVHVVVDKDAPPEPEQVIAP